ncbi:MAG: helix-turn-helix domain-containing protein, partial [Lachnospira sp.]
MIILAFPEKLKLLRTKLNLTQKEFADKLGVSQSS